MSREDAAHTINILLMGETGVGKSTFINAFSNYIQYDCFKTATKNKIVPVIPTTVTIYDEDTMESRTETIGCDENEKQKIGASATQDVRSYVFAVEDENFNIRLIDTPGFCDTGGLEQDDKNAQKILAYLTQLECVHGICLLMKPSNERNTFLFDYCVKRIFSQLHKSAADNIIFVFTNAKGTEYKPGTTLPMLRMMRNEIASEPPYVKIPIGKENVFCLDNEPIKHLLAQQLGDKLQPFTITSCDLSWEISSKEVCRIIEYVKKLEPHNLKQTISINAAKNLIERLSKPMSDICQLIQKNITALKVKEEESDNYHQNIQELQKKLYKPGFDLEVLKLKNAVTVCTSYNCTQQIQDQVVYKKCHEPCLVGWFATEQIGHFTLMTCQEMDWSFSCKKCQCPYKNHMTIYYDTVIIEKPVIDEDVEKHLQNEEEQKEAISKLIQKMKQEKNELEKELDFIKKCAARFAYFLQNNAIVLSQDFFKQYINLSLERARRIDNTANRASIINLTEMLSQHEELVRQLKENEGHLDDETVNEETVQIDVNQLLALKHAGPKIQEILQAKDLCVKNTQQIATKSFFVETVPKWFLLGASIASMVVSK